jgi:hypothetical protein
VHNGNGSKNDPIATLRKEPTSAAWTDPSLYSREPTAKPVPSWANVAPQSTSNPSVPASLPNQQKAFRTLRTIVLDVSVIASVFGFASFVILRPTPGFVAFVLGDLAVLWMLVAAVWRLTR